MISSAPSWLAGVTSQSGAAVFFFDQDAGPPPARVPGDQLPQVGMLLVGPCPLADHAERVAAVVLGGEVGDADGDVRAQVGVAVVAQQAGPVAVDGGGVGVEVAPSPAAGAVVDEPPAETVALQRPAGRVGAGDQGGDPRAALLVVGGLVAGQPGAGRGVAELEVGRAAEGGPGR
jgi:hypothetical protein